MPITTAPPSRPIAASGTVSLSRGVRTATLIVAAPVARMARDAVGQIGRRPIEAVPRDDRARRVRRHQILEARLPFDVHELGPVRERARQDAAAFLFRARRTARPPTARGRWRRRASGGPPARRPRRGRPRRRDAARPCPRAWPGRARRSRSRIESAVTVSHSSDPIRPLPITSSVVAFATNKKRLFNPGLKRRFESWCAGLARCQTLATAPSAAHAYHHQ